MIIDDNAFKRVGRGGGYIAAELPIERIGAAPADAVASGPADLRP